MKNRQKLKGSVLFTVVAVMMVVLVFVMSALTIAGATNRRAYSDYAKAQTQYTARSAIEATVEYLNENEDFQHMVEGMAKYATQDVEVNFPSDAQGLGSVDVQIKCEGKNTETGEDIVTITATSKMLDDETSVVAYISKKSPVINSGSFNRAMTSMGGASIGNHTSIFGGTSVNVLPRVENYDNLDSLPGGLTQIQNEGALEGETFSNGNLYIANNSEFIFDKPQDSLIVYGYYWEQNGAKFTSNVEPSEVTDPLQLPYIFVSETLFFNGTNNVATVGDFNSDDEQYNLINIFCKNINVSVSEKQINGNIYAFGTDSGYSNGKDDSYYTTIDEVIGDDIDVIEEGKQFISTFSGQKTRLLGWANKVINGSDGEAYCGGSIYTNGSAAFRPQNDPISVQKNIYVNQGMYVAERGVVVGTNDGFTAKDGIVYVGGELIVKSENAVQANELYVNNIDNIVFRNENSSFNLWTGTEYKNYNQANKAELSANPNFHIIDESNKWKYPEKCTYEKLLSDGGGFVTTKKKAASNYYGELADGSGNNGFYSMQTAPSSTGNIIYAVVNNAVRTYTKVASGGKSNFNPDTGSFSDVWDGSGEYYYDSSQDKPVSEILEISSNCTLAGSFPKVNIVVTPPSTLATLSINCVNFTLGENANLVVNDERDSEGVPLSTVKLFTNTYIKLFNKSKILTRSYKDMLDSGTLLDITQNPTKGNLDEMKYIPNIYVYCDGEGTLGVDYWNGSAMEHKICSMEIGNNSMVIGYIYSPEGPIHNNTTYNLSSNGIKYQGSDVKSDYTQTMNIGAVVCKDIYAQNNASIFYVNPNAAGADDDDGGSGGSYRILYYNNG